MWIWGIFMEVCTKRYRNKKGIYYSGLIYSAVDITARKIDTGCINYKGSIKNRRSRWNIGIIGRRFSQLKNNSSLVNNNELDWNFLQWLQRCEFWTCKVCPLQKPIKQQANITIQTLRMNEELININILIICWAISIVLELWFWLPSSQSSTMVWN